jgi:hypothetical protein
LSSGPRAALPKVAEHDTAHRGVVPGDDTSQLAGFPQCHHRPPGVGIYSHQERALDGVTGPTKQCLDRDIDPAAASGTGIPPPTQNLPPGAPFVPKVSSAGNHQGWPHLRADVVRNRRR